MTPECGSDDSPETECGCLTTAGRVSDHAEFTRGEFVEKDVDGSGTGAVAGPAGREEKSVEGCASCWVKSNRGGKCTDECD